MDGPDKLRLLERAVTASTNSIVIADPNQPDVPLVYVNPAFERTTGYVAEEVLGRNCRFLQGKDRDQPAIGELRTAVREGRHCTVVLRNYRKDGSLFWNELSIYPVRDEDGLTTSFVGVQNDITERIRTEEILSEIRRAERRRIARDLHDVVLQDLSGALQSLRLTHLRAKRSETSLDLEEELGALGRASSGLRNAIYDLRREKERPFLESVESLVELSRQAMPEREIRLVVEEGFDSGLPGRESVELLRVLQEALANVRRHSAARNVEVGLRTDDQAILIGVSDDGRGFDPGSAGAGVGLSAMRERAEGLGGDFEVRSRPGRGTEITASGFARRAVLQIPDVYDTFPHGVDHRLGSVEDVQLPVDVGGVVAYRLLRDAQRTCYLPVAHALGQGLYDLELPLGQRGSELSTTLESAALEGVEHLLGEVGGDYGIPREDRVDRTREILGL